MCRLVCSRFDFDVGAQILLEDIFQRYILLNTKLSTQRSMQHIFDYPSLMLDAKNPTDRIL